MRQTYSDVKTYTQDNPDYNQLLAQHAPMVKKIAYHLVGRLPSNVDVEEMIQAGMIGLLEALQGYDMSRGASFETYARIRIQGAMLDEVRRGDWSPRSVHKKSRQISSAIQEVEKREGRDARDSEIAEVLEMDIQQYHNLAKEAAGYQVLSYEDIILTDGNSGQDSVGQLHGPYDELMKGDFKKSLAENIAKLPERERLVMSLYYDDEFNFREIGQIIGVTEGRISQIHSQALVRLRARMAAWINEKA